MPRRRAAELEPPRHGLSARFDEDSDTIHLTTRAPANAPAPAQGESRSLIATQLDAMRDCFRQNGVTIASLQIEMLQVARAAAADGEYQAAGGLYKTIAQMLGGIQGEKHLHLHAPSSPEAQAAGDFRTTNDDALRALIAQARASSSIIDAPPSAVVDEPPSAIEAQSTHAHPADEQAPP